MFSAHGWVAPFKILLIDIYKCDTILGVFHTSPCEIQISSTVTRLPGNSGGHAANEKREFRNSIIWSGERIIKVDCNSHLSSNGPRERLKWDISENRLTDDHQKLIRLKSLSEASSNGARELNQAHSHLNQGVSS